MRTSSAETLTVKATEDTREIGKYDVLGVPVSAVTPMRAVNLIEQWANDDTGRFVCVRDVASLMAMRKDPAFAELHKVAAMVTPDGMPLAIIGRLRGFPVERTCGANVLDLVLSRSPKTGLKHYFYGGKSGIAEQLAQFFPEKYPGARIVGYESPPFGPLSEEEDRAATARIAASDADVVWIGLSSPKQDVWMWEHYKRLPQTLVGVGAAFDYHSGAIRRAPLWMQKSGLEWLHRLLSEPKRLWRRYLVLAPRFVFLAAFELFAWKTQA
ncbi:MAG: WecB/TagA/CpsF family glycosyltransferase [Nitrococcus sp.]|nr:WecB/TagA/CpsF family glycosyltransferase [Nitrococcus sp.]